MTIFIYKPLNYFFSYTLLFVRNTLLTFIINIDDWEVLHFELGLTSSVNH